MNPVVHFEMPAEDRQRMSDFYSKVFGWQTAIMGPEMGGYVVVTTTESDAVTGRPTTPGAINGGFYQKESNSKDDAPSVVISVEDIHEHVKKITEAGGVIITDPTDIPGVGTFASFRDTEGNRVSILQASSD